MTTSRSPLLAVITTRPATTYQSKVMAIFHRKDALIKGGQQLGGRSLEVVADQSQEAVKA